MTSHRLTIAITAVALIGGVSGFTPPSPLPRIARINSVESTKLYSKVSTGWDSFGSQTDMPDGEAQRKLRRTVYTHDDWKRHRSQDRFIYYLTAIFKSGVYKNLGREVGLVAGVASFVVVYNALVGGFTDFSGVEQAPLITNEFFHKLTIPMSALTITSPSLGLLLVFRTNSSYQRWDEARKNWGMNINHTRDLVRMANCYYDSTGVSAEKRADDLNHIALCTWAFVRAMKRHLSPEEEDETDFRAELFNKLPEQQAEMIIAAAHRPNRALQDLSYAIDDLPMHFIRKNEIHKAVTIFEDDLGSSERILTSPVPLFYSRHLARFLAIWLLFLPLGMYDSFKSSNHIVMIPTIAVIATMLFGIEEIGTQLEEPFTVLPMQAFCDKIYNWCMEISSWSPGDNGRAMKPVRPEHAYFADAQGVAGFVPAAPEVPVHEPTYATEASPMPTQEELNRQWAAPSFPDGVQAAAVEEFENAPGADYEDFFPAAMPDEMYEAAPTQEELNRRWASASLGRLP